MGTAQYLSPEQARGAPVTAASDLYSVGVVLYEMLTGQMPFTGDSAIEIAMKHLNETPAAALEPRGRRSRPSSTRSCSARSPRTRRSLPGRRGVQRRPRPRRGGPPGRAGDRRRPRRRFSPASRPPTAGDAGHLARRRHADPAAAPPRRPAGRRPIRRRLRLRARRPSGGAGCPGSSRSLHRRRGARRLVRLPRIQDELADSKPVAVPLVVGLAEEQARRASSRTPGFEAEVERAAEHRSEPRASVSEQKPEAGTRLPKGETVTIVVSTGVRRRPCRGLVGLAYEEAVDALQRPGLKAKRRGASSPTEPPGTSSARIRSRRRRSSRARPCEVRVSKGEEHADGPRRPLPGRRRAPRPSSRPPGSRSA